MNYKLEIEEIKEELFEIRKEIHRHPELGNEEFKTAALIEKVLKENGIEVTRLLDTAVVGTLKGALPGKTVALRADMDALPVKEETGCDFASQEDGKMHACGHDVHVTAALGAAMLLAKHRDELSGTVKFFFQPDEECFGGAERMIKAGCMGDTEAVFGAHVDPNLPEGVIGIRYGKFYAAADILDITVKGKTAHGATPEKGIDALMCAAEMILNLKEVPKKCAKDKCVLTIGKLTAGTARNIVSDHAVFSGILRVLGRDDQETMREGIKKCLDEIAEKYGATVDVQIHGSYGGIVNLDEETALAEHTARDIFGDSNVSIITEPKMITEDFGVFLEASKGSFYHIGAGNKEALHNSKFLPTEKALLTGAVMHAETLTAYLNA